MPCLPSVRPEPPLPAHALDDREQPSRYVTALEPDSLVQHFLDFPPVLFSAEFSREDMPSFVAPFDLLTTAEPALRRRVTTLPLYRHWGAVLRWRTRFAGCTVTEYAPLPRSADPGTLARSLRDQYGRGQALLIVKDIAEPSPLLDRADATRAADFAQACEQAGFVLLEGMELAWVAIDFADEDEYLGRLSRSRRKNIRRKLRSRQQLQIDMLPCGPAFAHDATVRDFHALYLNVHAQSEIHFDLLTGDFFAALLRDGDSGGLVFTYTCNGEMIGWNLCYVHAGKLVDKFIGLAYPQAREHNLYAVSWMHNLEYARQHRLSHYVAGWTDTQVKRELGARFSRTRHAVYVRNPLLRALLRRMKRLFEGAPAIAQQPSS